jgi:hypothetical protein
MSPDVRIVLSEADPTQLLIQDNRQYKSTEVPACIAYDRHCLYHSNLISYSSVIL